LGCPKWTVQQGKIMYKKYLPPVLWAILIFILSSIPGSNYPQAAFDFAPLAHFMEFFILTILVLRIFKTPNSKVIYLTLILCTLYALSDEIHQLFVINRSLSLLDLLIDFLAILSAIQFKIKSTNKKILT